MRRSHLLPALMLAALGLASCEKTEQLTNGKKAGNERPKAVNGTITDPTWTGYFQRTSGWTAGDATLSIPVTYNSTTAFSHNIWLFGDSHIDGINTVNNPDTRNCMYDIYNSIMRQDGFGNTFTTYIKSGTSGDGRTAVKFPENGLPKYDVSGQTLRLWPGHGFEEGNNVSAFYNGYTNSMAFMNGYNYIAEFPAIFTAASTVTVTRLTQLNSSDICWGMWSLRQGDSIFVYGTKRTDLTYGTSSAYVARVHRTKIKSTVSGDWKFWTGSAWSNSVTAAGAIKSGLSNHLSVVKFLNTSGQARYAIINQEVTYGCNTGTKIYSYGLASKPTGPFNTQKTLYTIADKLPGAPPTSNTMLTYDAQAHPEHAAYGLLLISYNVNGNCNGVACSPWTLQVPADGYRPKFIRSDIKDIDASLASVVQTW